MKPAVFHSEAEQEFFDAIIYYSPNSILMTVLEVIQRTTDFFAKKGLDSPRLQVELLLGHVLQLPRMKLYLNFERTLSDEELGKLRELVKRRGNREPLQHIVGQTNFCGLEIKSTASALVPRPETEGLVLMARKFLEQWTGDKRTLEIGTGTGCIAIALSKSSQVVAIDVSPEAIALAKENALQHKVEIDFRLGDTFEVVTDGDRFALLISNPPYIPSAEIAELAPEVRDFDPKLALDGGSDGLHFYRLIAQNGLRYMQKGGQVMVEFGDGQETAVENIFTEAGWTKPVISNDLSGCPRYFSATVPD